MISEEKKTLELFVTEKKDDMTLLVRQPYATTIARHRLNVHQMRILTRIIERLQPQMKFDKKIDEIEVEKENRVFRFKLNELLPSDSQHHTLLKKAIRGLIKQDIFFQKKNTKGEKIDIYTHLVQSVQHNHGSDIVSIEIDKEILPFLIALSKNYTKYQAQVSFNFSSPNIMKIYQYISQFRDKTLITAKADTLKHLLGMENNYTNRLDDFKRWVLLPIIQALKNKADVWFDIAEPLKEGRRLVGWKFNIYTKKVEKKKEAPKLEASLSPKKQEPGSEKEKQLVERYGLGLAQAKKLVKIIAPIELNKALHQIQVRQMNNEIRDMGAYSVTFLEKKFDIKL